MANRRMFAKTIIDSDAFLEMPSSSQMLYFHLSMRADDDGFVNNPKRIMRMIGAGEDDLKLLFVKRFLIGFESGVVVIKHWKIHNYIQKDRYTKTMYQEEFSRLDTKGNKAYTELTEPSNQAISSQCIQDGYKMDTQVRLGKDRLGKDREEVEALFKTEKNSFDYKKVIELYAEHCKELPQVRALTDSRKKTLKAWGNLEEIEEVFKKAGKSKFLTGGNDRKWQANFDWIIKPTNRVKILEDAYIDKEVKEEPKPRKLRSAEDILKEFNSQ